MVNGSKSTGENVIIGGLIVQIVFFGFFLVSATIFHRRIRNHPTPESVADYIPWQKHMTALYVSSTLILIRSIFRVVEYAQGSDGTLLKSEVFIYIFDALLMWAMMAAFLVVHPSEVNCLLGRGKVMAAKGGFMVSELSMAV